MIALVDTNVVLDVLLDREPFSEDSADVLSRAERGDIRGLVCATTVTTLHYLCRKVLGGRKTQRELKALVSIVDVAAVNRAVIDAALASTIEDFEDAVLAASGESAGADAIVTRNKRDFATASIAVYTPAEFLALLDVNGVN